MEITIEINGLIELLKKSYTQGYKSHDVIDAGLEPFDPETYARHLISTLEEKVDKPKTN